MQKFNIDTEQAKSDFLDCYNNLEITEQNGKFYYDGQETEFEFLINENFGSQRFLYGKNTTKNIVNISMKDNLIYEFYSDGTGEAYPYKPWVLSPFTSTGAVRLKGNQHYKYIKEYNSLEEYEAIKKNIWKYNLYSISHPAESFMIKNGHTYYKGMTPNQVKLLSFDIETTGLHSDAKDAKVLLITNMFRSETQTVKKVFNVEDYSSDKEMIADWEIFVQDLDADVLIGHNIVMFDLPYIQKRAGRPLKLGRQGTEIEIEKRTRELRKDGSQSYSYNRINCFGREIIDTFFLAIKADIGRKYDSYRLKAIIQAEGLEKADRQHYDAGSIKENWHIPEEREKIVKYAEDDAEDPIKLWDLMIPPFFYSTQYVPKPLQIMIESATGSQLNAMLVRAYLQDGYAVAKADQTDAFEGAISWGNPGIFRNTYKLDVASLYPSIMLEYKIENAEKDYHHVFQNILTTLRTERLKNKKLAKDGNRYYDDLQNTQKVLINSLYGFMGASGLNYNYPAGASEVTRKGREILKKAIKWATGIEYEQILEGVPTTRFELTNCDTDSIMIHKKDQSEFTEEELEQLTTEINSLYPNNISWEDDGNFHTVVCLKAKNYILYDGKKIKMKGSGIKDQKKEPALREMLDKMINDIIFNKSENLVAIYHKYIKEAMNPTDIKRWSQKKTLTKSVLNCENDPEARTNEKVVWEAVKSKELQEGDKFYVYPAVLDKKVEITVQKNGKEKVKEKIITGLKTNDDWSGDHDIDKLVERVVSTVDILANVVDTELFVDYSLKKNKELLEQI